MLSCNPSLTKRCSLTFALIFFCEHRPVVQSTALESILACILCPSGGLQTLLLTTPVMQSVWMANIQPKSSSVNGIHVIKVT